MKSKFILALILITLLGFFFRINGYDKNPPLHETDDELHYAWSGLTLLITGVPTSWSWLSSYSSFSMQQIGDRNYRLVSPVLEKPPLYLALSGATVYLQGVRDFAQITLAQIRVLPLILSLGTIFMIGLLAAKLFGSNIGLLSALLYAVNPFFTLANRLSVTENLFTPLILLFLFWENKIKNLDKNKGILLGVIAGLAFLTKQTGITLIATGAICFIYKREWLTLIKFLLISFSLGILYPLWGALYDWRLFLKTSAEIRLIGLQGGLPQVLWTVISRPLVGTERLFIDGTWLLGLLVLLATIITPKKQLSAKSGFFMFPVIYLIYFALILTGAEAIGSGQAFWGWYVYPLFPFLTIYAAGFMYEFWQKSSLTHYLFLLLTIGSSTVRYFLLFFPRSIHYRWQWLMAGLFILGLGMIISQKKFSRLVLLFLGLTFIGVNIYTCLHLQQIYP